MLGQLPSSHDAGTVVYRLKRLFARLPNTGYNTLTWDQGREMAARGDLEHAIGVAVSFADPHPPWQRPLNENRNGTICRWLGKSTDLSIYS